MSLSVPPPTSLVIRCSRLLLRVRQWTQYAPARALAFTPDYASLRPHYARPYPPHVRGPRGRVQFWRSVLRDLGAAVLVVVVAIAFVTGLYACLAP